MLEEDQFQHQSPKGSENAACEKVEHCVHFSLDARFDTFETRAGCGGVALADRDSRFRQSKPKVRKRLGAYGELGEW